MKRCPSCNRTYTDTSLNFCLEDGTPLVADAPPVDPNATIRYSSPRDTAEPPPTAPVVAPTLLATMKQYPNHAVNGMQMMKTVEGKQMPDPSLLIRIPSPAQGNSLLTSAPPGGANQLQPRAYPDQQSPQPQPQPDVRPVTRKPAPPPPQQPGLGKLKSIDG